MIKKIISKMYDLPIVPMGLSFFAGMLWAYFTAYGLNGLLEGIEKWQTMWSIAGATLLAFVSINAASFHDYKRDQLATKRKIFVDVMHIGTICAWANGFSKHALEAFKQGVLPKSELPAIPDGLFSNIGAHVGPHCVFLFIEVLELVEFLNIDTISKSDRHTAIKRLFEVSRKLQLWSKKVHEGGEIVDSSEVEWKRVKFPTDYSAKNYFGS